MDSVRTDGDGVGPSECLFSEALTGVFCIEGSLSVTAGVFSASGLH